MNKLVPAAIMSFFVLSTIHLTAQTKQLSKKKGQPNIIFILTDDLGYGDIGVFYQNQRKKVNDRSEPFTATPNIDKLATTGAMLPQHYCAAPVCAPARASFLSGVHQGHSNVRDNQFDKALEDNHTVASVLRTAGYKTAAFGKWGLQGLKNPGPDWPAHPLNRGFDYFMGMMRHADGHEHYPKEGLYRGAKQVWENKTNITSQLDKCYTTDLWTAAVKKWMVDFEKTGKGNQPFFIYLAYETPHAVLELPTSAYPAGAGIKGGMQWKGEPGHMINTASGTIDSWIHPDYAAATYDHDKNAATAELPWPDVYKRYATSVRRIDDAVGDIMQLLKDLDIDNNTLIVFTSDNGPSIESYLKEDYKANFFDSFGPFDGIKRDVWEGGVRVPTIANWPGSIPQNKVITTPSCVYDWLPTFADAAGIPAPARTDGVSLLPSLTGKGKQTESKVYVEYFHKSATPAFEEFDVKHQGHKRNQMQLIRLGDTVGVRYNIKSQNDNFEIYDIVKDPGQQVDLADRKGMDIVQTRMKESVLQMRRPDTSASRPYDEALVPATKPVKVAPGVKWSAYEGDFPWVSSVEKRRPSITGVGTLPAAVKLEKDGMLLFEGFLEIPEDGDYTFYISTNVGAVLRIHDATVIDADFGYQHGKEKSGIVKLQAGLHPYRLYQSVKKGRKQTLNFQWKGEGFGKQTIPAAVLKH